MSKTTKPPKKPPLSGAERARRCRAKRAKRWRELEAQAAGVAVAPLRHGEEADGALAAFQRDLHAAIVQRRQEARDSYRGWRPDNVHTLKQSVLLDWIERQLTATPERAYPAKLRRKMGRYS